MIENKEEYRNKRSEIMDREDALLDIIDEIDHVKSLMKTYNCNIDDLKERLEDELDDAEDEYHAHTKEEFETLTKINKEFSAGQIEQWLAQGYDTVDLINAYLGGELDKFREKKC